MPDYFAFGETIFEPAIENDGVSFPSQINPYWSTEQLPFHRKILLLPSADLLGLGNSE
jgi:hypothetical protein